MNSTDRIFTILKIIRILGIFFSLGSLSLVFPDQANALCGCITPPFPGMVVIGTPDCKHSDGTQCNTAQLGCVYNKCPEGLPQNLMWRFCKEDCSCHNSPNCRPPTNNCTVAPAGQCIGRCTWNFPGGGGKHGVQVDKHTSCEPLELQSFKVDLLARKVFEKV